MYLRRDRLSSAAQTYSAGYSRDNQNYPRGSNNYFVIDQPSSQVTSIRGSSTSPTARDSVAGSNLSLSSNNNLGVWKVRATKYEQGKLKLTAVSPPVFSQELISYVSSNKNLGYVENPAGESGVDSSEHLLCLYYEFCLVFFWTSRLDCFEIDKQDYHLLREYTLPFGQSGYFNILSHLRNIVLETESADNDVNFCKLKPFQFDLLQEALERNGRFIFNEKKIVGKRVLSYITMRLLQNIGKKIVIISAKKNTHHWKELICQWDGKLTKRNIILYKKDAKGGNWLKKDVIILNDALSKEFLKDATQAFIKGANFIIDKDVQCLDELADKLKEYAFRVCFISQSVNELKHTERLALLRLFEPNPHESSAESNDLYCLGDKKFDSYSICSQQLQKHLICLDQSKDYPEYNFKVNEQAFIINYDDSQIDLIKALKTLVSSGASSDVIKTYKRTFDKTDEDIRNMAKNLKGQFKDKEKYFFNHALESMKRAIDFFCTKLFAETKIPQTQSLIEHLIKDGNKKIVIWAFHCSILGKLVNFLRSSPVAHGFPVLEITSAMLDEKRTEITTEWNKLERGFLIIPFSVKKDRFKNLDFDVFLFVELTYNLEYFQSARNILYSPYLTKEKKLYIVVSPPADTYIWIKFETLYKKPDWDMYVKELKEQDKPYLVHDLVVKDDKVNSVISELAHIQMQLEVTNDKLKNDINKRKQDKAKDQRDRRRAARKSSSLEINEYINSLTDGSVLCREDERIMAEFYLNPPIKLRGHFYRRSMSKHTEMKLYEIIHRNLNLDLIELPDLQKQTLKKVKSQGESSFRKIFYEKLELLDEMDLRVKLLEDDFDVGVLEENHVEMLETLDVEAELQSRVDYAKLEHDLGYKIEIKDITQCSKSAATQSRFEPEEDAEFYEEMMNMLLATYYAVAKHKGMYPYFECPDYEFNKGSGLEYNFERMLLEGMQAINLERNFTIIFDMVDQTLGSPTLKELVKENFKLMIDKMGDDPNPIYSKLDLIDKVTRCVKRELEVVKEEQNRLGLETGELKVWDGTGDRDRERGGKTGEASSGMHTGSFKDTPDRFSLALDSAKEEERSLLLDEPYVEPASSAVGGLTNFSLPTSDFNIANDLDSNTNIGGFDSPQRLFGGAAFPESFRQSFPRRSRSQERDDLFDMLGKRKSLDRFEGFGSFGHPGEDPY